MKQKKDLWELEYRKNAELLITKILSQEQTLKDVSMELHDNVGQLLGLTKLKISLILNKEASPSLGELKDIQEIVTATISEVRKISKSLSGFEFDEGGIIHALQKELDRMSSSGKIQTGLELQGEWPNLPAHIEVSIFRVIQEAINNCQKHADAANFKLKIVRNSEGLQIQISDDGKGMNPLVELNDTGSGIGLISMRKRVRDIGGEFTMESAPGKGTTINIKVDIKN